MDICNKSCEEQKKDLLDQYSQEDLDYYKEILEISETYSFQGSTIIEITTEAGTNGK